VLYLGANHLQRLPAALGGLARLMLLYVGDNELAELPSTLTGLRHLRILNIHNNRLRMLPPELLQLVSRESPTSRPHLYAM
jgi:Leucine-rich repeat (LRR) protein